MNLPSIVLQCTRCCGYWLLVTICSCSRLQCFWVKSIQSCHSESYSVWNYFWKVSCWKILKLKLSISAWKRLAAETIHYSYVIYFTSGVRRRLLMQSKPSFHIAHHSVLGEMQTISNIHLSLARGLFAPFKM